MKYISEWFSKLEIKRKVQYIFISAVIVCVLFFIILFFSFMHLRMSESVLEKSTDNLNSIEQNFEAVVSNVNSISKIIMTNDIVTAYLKRDVESQIDANLARSEVYSILNSFDGGYSVFVFRNDTSYIKTGIGIIQADKHVIFQSDWFGYVNRLEGMFTLIPNSSGAFSFNTKTDIVSFARIINDVDTQMPIGMLVINIPVSELRRTYENLSGNENGFAYLDSDLKSICSDMNGDDLRVITERFKDHPETLSMKGIFNTKIIISRKLADSDISLICKSDVRIMEGVTTELAAIIIGVLFIVIIIMLFVNTCINRYMTYPLSKLADSMKKAESGLLMRVSVRTNDDEIGRLKERYNDMLVQINRLIEKLVEQERQRQQAEMNVIQEQMKPHFLYNTLDTIAYMSLENSREEVYGAIETLGSFYRRFLSKGSENIPVSAEIAIVRDYIKLQRLRYNDIFEDEYDIQEDLGDIKIPKLILQPLVENSIYHGIRPKGEHGIIRIKIFSEDDYMHIIIYDSGIGMTQEQINGLMSGSNEKSFGFKATMERIKNYYQKKNVFEIKSCVGEYCEIEIKIPLKY
ncbi:MAG: histidine kinase [Oscillospiraceae bacterium]|nr:histidine kinase [Oscillospiraceae bacterium]